jgi:cytosine/adenosine deaminase-related metal-dependent hydrolase
VRPALDTDTGPIYDVVMPGLIDAHSHARAIPVAAHGVRGGPLERFLVMLSAMTPLDPRDEALVAADAGLAAGITSTQVIHHTFGPPAQYERHLRSILAGYTEAGVRAAVTLAFSDQDEYAPLSLLAGTPVSLRNVPSPQREMGTPEFGELADRWLRGREPGAGADEHEMTAGADGLVSVDGVGPVAPQWCSAEANAAAGRARGESRVHAHLLESPRQRSAARVSDPVRALLDAGLVGPWSSFAHGVQLEASDRERLAANGATVVHCPGSNHNLNVGSCRVRQLLDDGVCVALGIDSNGACVEPDMFMEMRAALTTAEQLGEPLATSEVLAMATSGGARALCRPDLGVLAPGATADVIALELPDSAGCEDPLSEVVRRADRDSVAARWIAGRRQEPTGALQARARLRERMEADLPDRVARMTRTFDRWRRVHETWTAFQARTAAR